VSNAEQAVQNLAPGRLLTLDVTRHQLRFTESGSLAGIKSKPSAAAASALGLIARRTRARPAGLGKACLIQALPRPVGL